LSRGFFITFEGLEGAGKSTQIKLLQKHLISRGFSTVVTREPGGTYIGDEIRDILLDIDNKDIDYKVEAFLYAASRAQLISKIIKPALEDGKIVLSDRYIDSSLAYQGYGRGLPIDLILEFNEWGTDALQSDLTFLLRLPAEVGLARNVTGQADRIESESLPFHKRVEKGYDEMAAMNKDRYHVLDGTRQTSLVSDEIIAVVDKLLATIHV
jgi:dTMP kinase